MNELTAKTIQLPDNVEDLAKFTLIGREKLNAVRAEIRAKHPDWNALQVSIYLQSMADIFEGQGLIQRPQRGWL